MDRKLQTEIQTRTLQATLTVSQYSQENTSAGPCKPFFTENLRWLLLDFRDSKTFFLAESSIYY